MPFSVVRSDGDSESEGEGLSGRPAFSSVLTVMAGTVKHPVSLDQSRTSPTITRDETLTTQWPSHSSSQGSEMSSSSSSSAGDRIPLASSGLTLSTSHQHPTAVTMASIVSWPSHVDGNTDVSSWTVSSPSLSPSMSSSASSTSSVLSLFSLSSSAGWINKAALSQGQRIESSPAPQTLSPAGSLGWTDSLTTTHSTTHLIVDPPAVTQALQSTTKPSHFSSETSVEKSNEVTKHSLYSSVDTIYGVSEAYIRSTKVIKSPAASTYTSYSSPNRGENLLKILYKTTQTQNPGMNSESANNLEISTSFPSNQESQAVQRQQGALQNPTSALLSAHPKGYSVSSHVTQQMLNQTAAYAEKGAEDTQTFVHRSVGGTTTLPLSSHVVNPTVSTALMFRLTETAAGKTSLSETAITERSPIHSGTVSSEPASNPGDLLMAAGHGSPRVPAININYNPGEIAGAELKSISAQAHLNNSLSLTGPSPESAAGSILGLITRTGTTSSTSELDSLHLPSNGVINDHEFVTQTGSPKGITQEPREWTTPKIRFSSHSMSLSGSALPVSLANDMTYKTTYESLSHTTRPTYLLPLFLSHSPNNTSANSEVNFADQPKASLSSHVSPTQRPFQTLTFPHNFYTTPNKSHQTVSSAELSAHIIKSERAARSISSTFEVETTAGISETSPTSDAHTTHGKKPTESSVSPLFKGNEESTLITVFYKKDIPPGQFTTNFPSFKTTKDPFMLNKGSEASLTEIPVSKVTSDAAFEPLKGLVTQSSPSSRSEIILTPRTNSASRSQGPITSVRSDRSNFYLGRQKPIPSTASSAATTSSSDGQNSSESFRAIFSFGTKLMAPYTKWKATKPVSFQSTAFELENTSIGFDRADTNFQADGPSYEHPKLEDGQEGNAQISNSIDPTVVARDPKSSYSTVGEHPSFTYVKSTAEYEKQKLSLSPANLISAVNVKQGVNTAWGSDGFLPLSHTTPGSVTSSKASPLALVYKSKQHSPPPADVDSLEYAFDAAVTLSNSPAPSFSYTDNINKTTDSKLRAFTLPTEPVPSSSSFHSSPSSERSIKASPLSFLHLKPPTSVSSTSSSLLHPAGKLLSIKPTMHPGTASSATFLSSSPHPDRSDEVTETFVVLTEAGMDELTAGTSRAVALTFPKEKAASLAPSQSVRITLSAGPTERTSQVSPLPPRQDAPTDSVHLTTTTVATTKTTATMPSLRVTTGTTQSATTTTPQPAPVTKRTTTTTTVRTHTSRRTFTPPFPRTSPPRGVTTIFVSPFTTTTEAPPQQCNITERLWVKTGKQYFYHGLKKIIKS